MNLLHENKKNYFIIKNIFDICGCLTFIFFPCFFNDKIDLRLFLLSYDDLTKYYHLSRSIFSEKIIFIPFLDPKM